MTNPQQKWYALCGAVAVGFVVGACSRSLPVGSMAPIEPPAQAQSQAQEIGRNYAQLLSAANAAVVRAVTPAVVNINSQQIIPGRVLRDPFDDFFGDDSGGGGMFREPDRRAQSLGSGVIVDGRGIIITNNHVIANASTITVTLNDRRRFSARLLGTDTAGDVAVLKIDAPSDKPLPTIKWANSDKLQVGDLVMAVGSPFNLASTVTQGIISAKGRHDLGISDYEDFLQTDAAINPGNSGGALVDMDGNLIGINTAILSESGGNQGIGLAIPSNLVRKLSAELIANGHVTRGWMGVVVEPLTDDVAGTIGLNQQSQGVVVTGIYTRGPASGLPWSQQGGDVILKANGVPIDSPGQLRNMVADLAPGSTLSLEVWQNGQTHTFNVKLAVRPPRARGV